MCPEKRAGRQYGIELICKLGRRIIKGCLRTYNLFCMFSFCFLPENSAGDTPGRGIISIYFIYERREKSDREIAK